MTTTKTALPSKFSFAGVALLGLFSATALGCHRDVTRATIDPGQQGIAVSGVGEATAAPDIARIQMGVRARGSDVGTATASVQSRTKAILAVLAERGVETKDIVTRNVSIHEEYRRPVPRPIDGSTETLTPAEYVASNIVEVTVRDLEGMDQLLAAVTRAGVNQMHGITFELEDHSAADEEALAEAMAEAKARAQRLAELGGRSLGDIVSIELGDARVRPIAPMARTAMAEAADGGAMPVEPGEVKIHRTVHVRYAWK
jgi:uncharacterized protein YggE